MIYNGLRTNLTDVKVEIRRLKEEDGAKITMFVYSDRIHLLSAGKDEIWQLDIKGLTPNTERELLKEADEVSTII